ncbi:unnamed protein product [Auanema sp. JU1783]|nr:unnamed protein product [Auanema sp. JU1783]
MQWLLVASFCFHICYGQVLNYHPAAIEANFDDIVYGIKKNVDLLNNGDVESNSVVGPNGKVLIIPAMEEVKNTKSEIREETEEILKVLYPSKNGSIDWFTWSCAVFGCMLVVSCGILPVVLLPANSSEVLLSKNSKKRMDLLLAFAVGSILADAFLHLLPEIWATHECATTIGLWVLIGFLVCFSAEKICESTENNCNQLCAIINLSCNVVDNFTHGLAVAGSFLVSMHFGLMTTFSVLLHEIPHEMVDFALLLRANYSRKEALKAQLVTATGGVLGAFVALQAGQDVSTRFEWILPFTAGGFINIAMTQLIPELNEETDKKRSIMQLIMTLLGVGMVALIDVGFSA